MGMEMKQVLAATLMLVLPAAARAHALGVQCQIRGGQVVIEAYYDDDSPARKAKVAVRDGLGKVVAEGWTDDQGRWVFPLPHRGQYHVVVDDGAGHRVQTTLFGQEGQPSREEFTRTPWIKIAIGLAAIGGFALALWLARRQKAATPPPAVNPGDNL